MFSCAFALRPSASRWGSEAESSIDERSFFKPGRPKGKYGRYGGWSFHPNGSGTAVERKVNKSQSFLARSAVDDLGCWLDSVRIDCSKDLTRCWSHSLSVSKMYVLFVCEFACAQSMRFVYTFRDGGCRLQALKQTAEPKDVESRWCYVVFRTFIYSKYYKFIWGRPEIFNMQTLDLSTYCNWCKVLVGAVAYEKCSNLGFLDGQGARLPLHFWWQQLGTNRFCLSSGSNWMVAKCIRWSFTPEICLFKYAVKRALLRIHHTLPCIDTWWDARCEIQPCQTQTKAVPLGVVRAPREYRAMLQGLWVTQALVLYSGSILTDAKQSCWCRWM